MAGDTELTRALTQESATEKLLKALEAEKEKIDISPLFALASPKVAEVLSKTYQKPMSDVEIEAAKRKIYEEEGLKAARAENEIYKRQIEQAKFEQDERKLQQSANQFALNLERQSKQFKDQLSFHKKKWEDELALKNRMFDEKVKSDLEKTKKDPKYNSNQYQAAGFGHRMVQANQVLEELTQDPNYDITGWSPASQRFEVLSLGWPAVLQSQEFKRQDQAERNFVNAVLRRESGAAISDKEFENAEKQYFPRIGDGPEALEQKKQNRMQVMQAMKAEAKGAWEEVSLDVEVVNIETGEEGTIPADRIDEAISSGRFRRK